MRIALDTNVLLSVILFKSKKLALMLDWICQHHTLLLSTYVIDECHEVVLRKGPSYMPALDRFLEALPYEIVKLCIPRLRQMRISSYQEMQILRLLYLKNLIS